MTFAYFLIAFSLICITVLIISNIKLWIELKAMQKSTHQVQYVNMGKQEFQEFNQELKEKLQKELYDNLV